jgi:hypothetical protein
MHLPAPDPACYRLDDKWDEKLNIEIKVKLRLWLMEACKQTFSVRVVKNKGYFNI